MMHNFRRYFAITILALICVVSIYAQDVKKSREEMRKEIVEFKIKFLAQEINLQKDQQEKFAELYSQLSQEKMKIFSNAMKLERKLRNSADATDADYAEASKVMAEARAKDIELDKQYDKKFAAFLTSKQIFQMKTAEEKFRRKMEEMRKNGKNKHHNHESHPAKRKRGQND